LLNEINTFIQKGCIKLNKSDSKMFLMLQKLSISDLSLKGYKVTQCTFYVILHSGN